LTSASGTCGSGLAVGEGALAVAVGVVVLSGVRVNVCVTLGFAVCVGVAVKACVGLSVCVAVAV
jgi:hypothetical protein